MFNLGESVYPPWRLAALIITAATRVSGSIWSWRSLQGQSRPFIALRPLAALTVLISAATYAAAIYLNVDYYSLVTFH
jgi:hypothetical protein